MEKAERVRAINTITSANAASRPALAAKVLTVAAGISLILFAAMADRAWLDRHILPHLFLQRGEEVLWWTVERSLAFLTGVALALPIRQYIGRAFDAGRGADLLINALFAAAAVPLALLTSELILRSGDWVRLERWATSEEPLRRADPLLGWANVPGRTGVERFGGRTIPYVIDARGRRVAGLHQELDEGRASILLTGESILFGFRLGWRESLAGRLEVATRLQSVNVAVNGYGIDQELMRLRQELPRFRHPVAVVCLFAPALLERSLDTHRPYLDATLRWHPPAPAWRLERVFKNVFLYHSTRRIDAAVATARSSLAAIVAEARAHNAVPLILVPEFAPEQPAERKLRERVLAGLPYVRVELDRRWSLPGDGHPDARANAVMAEAIRVRLAASRPSLNPGLSR